MCEAADARGAGEEKPLIQDGSAEEVQGEYYGHQPPPLLPGYE